MPTLTKEQIDGAIASYFFGCLQKLKSQAQYGEMIHKLAPKQTEGTEFGLLEDAYRAYVSKDYLFDDWFINTSENGSELPQPINQDIDSIDPETFSFEDLEFENSFVYARAGLARALLDPNKMKQRQFIKQEDIQDHFMSKYFGNEFDTPMSRSLVNPRLAQTVKALNNCQKAEIGFEPSDSFEAFLNRDIYSSLEINPQVRSHSPDVKKNDKEISDLLNMYLKEDNTNQQNKDAKRKSINLFIQLTGTKKVNSIDKSKAFAFKSELQDLPKNYHLFETIEDAKKAGGEKLTITTMNKHLNYSSGFIEWCKNNGFYHGENPFSGIKIKDRQKDIDKRHPYNDEQLKKIFSGSIYYGCKSRGRRNSTGTLIVRDDKYWIPLIALFTGARMNEICQMDIKDIESEVHEGKEIYYFHFTDEADDKKLKNSGSKRKVPIHKELIDLGFLDYIKFAKKKKYSKVFPNLILDKTTNSYSKLWGKKYAQYAEACDANIAKTSFHSFRHNVIDVFRNNSNLSTIDYASITGHKVTDAIASYGSTKKIPALKGIVDLLEYSCINFEEIKKRGQSAPFE